MAHNSTAQRNGHSQDVQVVPNHDLALQTCQAPSRPSINQLLRPSFQSLEIRNDVLTISGVRNGDEHLRAVNVACRVLEPLIERLLIPLEFAALSAGE